MLSTLLGWAGLLGDEAPRTSVKWRVPGVGSTGEAIFSERLRSIRSPASVRPSACTWQEGEVPLLKLCVHNTDALERTTLIVALYDRDTTSRDDRLGTVRIPLGRPAAAKGVAADEAADRRAGASEGGAAEASPEGVTWITAAEGDDSTSRAFSPYSIHADEPIIFGHAEPSGGRLKCDIRVTRLESTRQRSEPHLKRQVTSIEDSAHIEKLRQLEASRPWFIIDPRHSHFLAYWDLTTGLALVFTALVTPWEVRAAPIGGVHLHLPSSRP